MIKPALMPNECQKAQIARKYGMFIHYGVNTFNEIEWSDGKLPASSVAPTALDVDQWVRNAYELGMTYIVLITKHHDGFCLWDSKYTDYSVASSPVKTDIIAEASKACAKYGLKLGIYYSLWDRHEPCYKKHKKYVDYMCNQLAEILDGRYGDICELWLDGGWDKKCTQWDIERLYALTKRFQPDCAFSVNVTIGKFNTKGGRQEKFSPENYKENMPMKYFPCDFRLLDPYFPQKEDPKIYKFRGNKYYLPFEATICIRDMKNWFWDTKYTQDRLLDVDFIVDKYNTLISQNNVLVVNVAPNTVGIQEQSDIDRLMEASKILGIARKL